MKTKTRINAYVSEEQNRTSRIIKSYSQKY